MDHLFDGGHPELEKRDLQDGVEEPFENIQEDVGEEDMWPTDDEFVEQLGSTRLDLFDTLIYLGNMIPERFRKFNRYWM